MSDVVKHTMPQPLPREVRTHELAHMLHPVALKELVRRWLSEDTPSYDYGGFVVGDRSESAALLCKAPGVLAGAPFVNAVFAELGCHVTWHFNEGDELRPICRVATIEGCAKDILLGERVALNALARASGVATLSRRLKRLAEISGWRGEVAATRKTTPGFRMVEKYAALIGGASTHRYDLSSMVMLKDNHIWAVGSVTEVGRDLLQNCGLGIYFKNQAVQAARRACGFSLKIEVECRTYREATEAVEAGCDVVMLDNFEPEALHETSRLLKEAHPNIIIEASGGINELNIAKFFSTSVDVISLSKITQGYECVDYSMKIVRQEHDPANPVVTLASATLS